MSALVIELAPGAEDNGLANLIAELLRQNLHDHPHKGRDFARLRGRVALVAEDAERSLTLHFRRGRAEVHDGLRGVPDVVVWGYSEDLVNLSRIPLVPRLKLPDLRDEAAREILRAVRSGRLRSHGGLSHPRLTLGLARLLSIHP